VIPGVDLAVAAVQEANMERTGERAEAASMTEEYVETGGLRWSLPFGLVANASWPFAKIRISPERIRLTVKFWRIWDLAFDFEKAELQALRRKRGWINVGLQCQHDKAGYPSLLVFWTLKPKILFSELRRLGYNVLD